MSPKNMLAHLKRISNWLYKISTGWVALAGLVVFILFTALVLPAQSQQAEKISGEAGSPDMSFYYAPQDLYNMAEIYGAEGRAAYIRARFTFDLIWPVIYTLFLGTAISWTFGRAFGSESRVYGVNLAPVFGIIFDYLENIATAWVMYRYPLPADIAARMAPCFTAAKWLFIGGSFILVLIGILGVIWRSISKRIK